MTPDATSGAEPFGAGTAGLAPGGGPADTADAVAAFLAAFAEEGWAGARLDVVARRSGLSAAALVAAVGDRWGALRAYGRQLEAAALEQLISADPSASVRDNLFDVLMGLFERMQQDRAAVRRLVGQARRDPALAAFFAASLPPSIARLGEASGVETRGLFGPARIAGLTALCVNALRAWLDDADADLGATMKALDATLARAERWASRLPATPGEVLRGRPAAQAAGSQEPAPAILPSPETMRPLSG